MTSKEMQNKNQFLVVCVLSILNTPYNTNNNTPYHTNTSILNTPWYYLVLSNF